MVKNILIFVPNSLILNKSGYLEGFRQEYDECEAYYITSDVTVKHTENVIGFLGNDVTKVKNIDFKAVHIDTTSKISLLNFGNSANLSLVRIVYDFGAFRDCDDLDYEDEYGVHFKFLRSHLRKPRWRNEENGRKNTLTCIIAILDWLLQFLNKFKLVWAYSATISHFCDNLNEFKWFFAEVNKEKRMSPRIGNFILAKLVDLALGIILLRIFIHNEDLIVNFIDNIRETLIYNFRHLLIYLMGSPIGLKLNYAFNKSLGRFFFYHISLWRVFLFTMQPFVKQYFKFLVLPGTFGFSYQIAMLSDLISIATFHVYCIYVYAARLIYLQLKGLLSLWRLFIGRKYNPLRARVDSCQYSQHQLFIGTLGFTVLLFLLPTTTLYYTVFVIFRLAIMIVEEILLRFRYLLQCFPIYIFILWVLKSPKMSGPVCLKWRKSKNGIMTLEAYLKILPLTSLQTFAPNTKKSRTTLSWSKIFTGVLL
ncbi:phosphatidylinositol N-acetylglucosaminyltransferase subunit Q [Tribolium madens]|uniref:phosphatidylinositol N-acetylglucosaminyltransferase subunit Q n=1 Tax=Tribolium madens TaxID=41895 RepID=UPI001CF746A3|nr:phosphatidylinositol N-acetylglucosaminyltransferase subunit Q [Tribolium madens]